MKRSLYLILFVVFTIIPLGTKQAQAAPNMAAMYCLSLGYEYDVKVGKLGGEQGICRLPNGVEVNDWAFYKGKVASEYSYCARHGYQAVSEVSEHKGYRHAQAMCVTKGSDGSIGNSIPLAEFMDMHGDALPVPAPKKERNVSDAKDVCTVGPLTSLRAAPQSFDWRNHNGHSYIGAIRSQGDCGSCYSFGATAAAEATYNIASNLTDNNVADFSEAFLAFCLDDYYSGFGGCDGADYTYSELQALVDYGVINESVYPYSDYDQNCPGGMMDNPRIQFSDWGRVGCNDIEAIKNAIMTYGVVDAAVLVEGDFDGYDGGIYSDGNTSCDASPCYDATTNHAIALVGWGHDAAQGDYWILRNSWGESWGEDGYMRIAATSAKVACAVTYLEYGTKPLAITGDASDRTQNSARVAGMVNPRGLATTYYFEYGRTAAYDMMTATVSAGSGSNDVTVDASISGLLAEQTYHYRLVASNTSGTTYGADAVFNTTGQPAVPEAVTLAATTVKGRSAVFNATVNPHYSATTWYFEYGTSASMGSTSQSFQLEPLNANTDVSLRIAGLEPLTTHYVRIVATNTLGTTRGAVQTFTTPRAPILEEDFEGGVMPDGWQNSTASSQGWFVTTNGSSTYFEIPDHTVYACANDDMANDDGSMDYLLTPVISFAGYTDVYMTFNSFYDGQYSQLATVRISTDGGSTWSDVQTISASTQWNEVTLDLSAWDGMDNIMLAFHADDAGAWAGGWAVDDIIVDGTAEEPVVGAPVFTPPPGTVTAGTTVTITSSTAGAWIYYTTDGSVPGWGSSPYSGPVTISQTTTLKSIAFTADGRSTVTTGLYTVENCSCHEVNECCNGCTPINISGACGDATSSVCDRADTCDALGVCQANLLPQTVVCRGSESECDIPEYCDGNGGCPRNQVKPEGTECGSSRDTVCDNPDSCNGSGVCVSNFEGPQVLCRQAEGDCDAAEYCDGRGICPTDGYAPQGTACGSDIENTCNHADTCNGSGICQPNFESASTVCRAAASECDLPEYCNGTGGCPQNEVKAEGTACGSSRDTVCDNPDTCDGSGQCQNNYESGDFVCRVSAGECDVAEYCDGAGVCPVNAFGPQGEACGSQTSGVCDNPDTCDGAGECLDNHASSDTLCRPADGQCDVDEYCNAAGQCPGDSWVTDGTLCDDGLACSMDDQCNNGICTGTVADCDDGNECTFDTCSDEDGGCVNEAAPEWYQCGIDVNTPMACFTGICEALPAGDDCSAALPVTIGETYSGSFEGYHRYRNPDDACMDTVPQGPDVLHSVTMDGNALYRIEAVSDGGQDIAVVIYLECDEQSTCFEGLYGQGAVSAIDLAFEEEASLFIQVIGASEDDTYSLLVEEQPVIDGDDDVVDAVDLTDPEPEVDDIDAIDSEIVDGDVVEQEDDVVGDEEPDTDGDVEVDGDTEIEGDTEIDGDAEEAVDGDSDVIDGDDDSMEEELDDITDAVDTTENDIIVDGDDDSSDAIVDAVDDDIIEQETADAVDAVDSVDSNRPGISTGGGGCAAGSSWLWLLLAGLGMLRRKQR